MVIQFRPHHFLCALCFKGSGYSPAFIKNFQTILTTLATSNDETMIEVVAHTDSICAPCPKREGLRCQTEQEVVFLDQQHAALLQLSPGMKLTWREAKLRMKDLLTLDGFHKACATCSWKEYGICEKVITEFLLATS